MFQSKLKANIIMTNSATHAYKTLYVQVMYLMILENLRNPT